MLTLFLRSTQHRRMAFASAVAASALLMSACAGGEVGSEPDAENPINAAIEVVIDVAAEPITGVGPRMETPIELEVPDGAQSLSVEFRCEGSEGFLVEYGDPMIDGIGSFFGDCNTESSFTWPIRPNIRPALFVLVDTEAEWTMVPTLSAVPFVSDPAVEADCAGYVEVISAYHNADSGYSFYDAVTADEWAERVETAGLLLTALIDSAESELVESFQSILEGVSASGVEAGQALMRAADDMRDVQRACDRNHTPMYIQAEFGG